MHRAVLCSKVIKGNERGGGSSNDMLDAIKDAMRRWKKLTGRKKMNRYVIDIGQDMGLGPCRKVEGTP